jgi:hypothetical protein
MDMLHRCKREHITLSHRRLQGEMPMMSKALAGVSERRPQIRRN